MLTEEIVTLRGCDDVKVECPVNVCGPSEFLQTQIDDVENQDGCEIVVPKVTGATLGHIITFLKHHAIEPLMKIEHPVEGNTVEEVVTQEWYAKFINEMAEKDVYKVLLAANFLHVQPLLDLVVIRIAWIFSKKTPDELKKFLNFQGLTNEQDAQARIDHPWIFEK